MPNNKRSLISKTSATKEEVQEAVEQYKSTYGKAKQRLQAQAAEEDENHKDEKNS